MFNNVEEGFRDVFRDTIEGIAAGALIQATVEAIKTLPNVPSYYPALFQLIEVAMLIGSILAVFEIESWRFMYLLGWIIGMWILYSVKLVEPWLFYLYVGVGIPVLTARILKELGVSV